jgi:hypothetical protein
MTGSTEATRPTRVLGGTRRPLLQTRPSPRDVAPKHRRVLPLERRGERVLAGSDHRAVDGEEQSTRRCADVRSAWEDPSLGGLGRHVVISVRRPPDSAAPLTHAPRSPREVPEAL